ncbi:MFS transporter [Planotetraspora sp. A-T 1434]|uniref:MFS transporter n=1 Tax=Planotetraspora sp. A-T 1434 TaxID=2979219 RepID=UPI0021BF7670|nr:MFS transporter [Planotetraspora sp. A-T 1434]MCT9935282.1 MFS transporter [Planotetraspora sp. A-T 1434]
MGSTTTVQSARLTRDRPTWLIYLQLATFATYLYGLSAALPTLRAELGLSQAVAGLHGTAMAAGGIASGLILSVLTARFGRRVTVWAGLAGMDAGILIVALGHSLPLTLLGYTLAGGCSSIALYAAMAVLSDHHGPAGAAALSEANAVGVTAGIATSYAFSLLAGSALGWRSALYVPILATALLALTMGRVWVPAIAPPPRAAGEGHDGAAGGRVNTVPYGRRFHVAGAVLLCCVGLEFSYNLWGAELFAQQTGLTAAAAAKGLTAMLAGMAAGRFGGARLALRFAPSTVLLGGLTVALAGWALFWTSGSQPAGYAGLALSGLGISVLFPLALARIIDASGGRPDQASAIASIWAGVGAGTAPFALGALGDGFGTHTAFLLAPALIGLAIGGILSSRSRS